MKAAKNLALALAWLWPVAAGVILGATALAPWTRSPGDPSGHSIGAGLGGLIGLVAALILRRKVKRRTADVPHSVSSSDVPSAASQQESADQTLPPASG
jgi:hypothetical protein